MGLFGSPKPQPVVPIVNPDDNQNRVSDALARRLASGGSNADQTSGNTLAPVGAGPMGRLTGLN